MTSRLKTLDNTLVANNVYWLLFWLLSVSLTGVVLWSSLEARREIEAVNQSVGQIQIAIDPSGALISSDLPDSERYKETFYAVRGNGLGDELVRMVAFGQLEEAAVYGFSDNVEFGVADVNSSRQLVFSTVDPDEGSSLYLLRIGADEPVVIDQRPVESYSRVSFSPDSVQVAFFVETGDSEDLIVIDSRSGKEVLVRNDFVPDLGGGKWVYEILGWASTNELVLQETCDCGEKAPLLRIMNVETGSVDLLSLVATDDADEYTNIEDVDLIASRTGVIDGVSFAEDGLFFAGYASDGVYVVNAATGERRRVTTAERGHTGELLWSTDSRLLVFADEYGVGGDLHVVNLSLGRVSELGGVEDVKFVPQFWLDDYRIVVRREQPSLVEYGYVDVRDGSYGMLELGDFVSEVVGWR